MRRNPISQAVETLLPSPRLQQAHEEHQAWLRFNQERLDAARLHDQQIQPLPPTKPSKELWRVVEVAQAEVQRAMGIPRAMLRAHKSGTGMVVTHYDPNRGEMTISSVPL